MIIGNILDKTQENFLENNKTLNDAINFLKNKDFNFNEGEKHIIDDNLFSFINKINTREFDNKFEAHKKHLDIFYVHKGIEDVYVAKTISSKVIEDYNPDKDVYFLENDEYIKITLHEGDFIILFPEDAHAPAIGDGSYLEKVVIKVKL